MIDLHFHCLPGIDDGPRQWDEAVQLCRQAASQGTTRIVATPHVLRDAWLNDNTSERDQLLLRLNTLLGGTPAVLPGCEYFFSADAVELWELGAAGPLYGLNRSRYLLTEFPATSVAPYSEDVFYELVLAGVIPVIAHPERNLVFAREPERLERLVELGAVVQVTAASLLGEWGKNAEAACVEFHNRGLIHLVASDAHSSDRRPPRLKDALDFAVTRWGEAAAKAVFISNAEAVLASEPLPHPRPTL